MKHFANAKSNVISSNVLLPAWILSFFIMAIIPNSVLYAADSVVVQTFTFDSIICRQSTFKFPDKNEKFYKVIGKYRLKCDPKTQHDKWDCGEWDYHAYTRILNYPEANLLYADTKFPTTTFGSLLLPTTGNTLQLSLTKVMDKHRYNYYQTNTSASNEVKHTINTSDTVLESYSNHQFLIRESDLVDGGLKANDKIGKMTIGANIVDTIHNVVVRALQTDASSLLYYVDDINFDTIVVLSHIAPQDCVNGKIAIDFMHDFVWNGRDGIIFEIMCNPINNSANTFKMDIATGLRSQLSKPFNYATFSDANSWIDIDMPNIAGTLKKQFTIEGWFKINSADTASLDNAVLFSIGDKFVVRLGSDHEAKDDVGNYYKNRTKIYIEKFNEENQVNNTKNNCIKYDQWQHIAIVFDGEGEISPNRLKVFINGENQPMWYAAWGVNSGWAEANSYVHHYLDSTDAHLTIGKGEYAANTETNVKHNFTGTMSHIRVWNTALIESNILSNMYLTNIENSHPNYSNLIINLLCNEQYAARTMINSSNNYTNVVGRVIGGIYFDNKNNGVAIPWQTDETYIPELELFTGDFAYSNTLKEIEIEKEQIPISLVEFDATKTSYPSIKQITYHYQPLQNIYDANHNIIETNPLTSVDEYAVTAGADLYTYSKRVRTPWQIFEIGRYITPYGIGGLPMVADGFVWEYDYTDYMHLLRDSVMLAVHNLQELIDLQFIFYKGDPIREVISVTEPWGPTQHTALYKDLVADKSFAEPRDIKLDANTKSVKLKTRITGHGMEASTDKRYQCCEFYNNTHYLYADTNGSGNLAQIRTWRIWRSCTENPVYPQGGTWYLQREGWCPGDAVKEYEYELTPYIKNGSVKVKYGISDAAYKYDTKMGNGYYTMGLQLIQYGAAQYKNDLELCKVTHPSTDELYSRFNPICNGIEFVVRNNSDVNMTKFDVEVETKNPNTNQTLTYTQTFSKIIQPHSYYSDKIYLTTDEANNMWYAAGQSKQPQITVRVVNSTNTHGSIDENLANNEITQAIKLPDIWNKNDVVIKYRTNNRPFDYNLRIYNCMGIITKTLSVQAANTEYQYKLSDLNLPDGCYTFEIESKDMYPSNNIYFGLSSGMDPSIGNGSIGFYSPDASKTFQPEFGRYFRYSFVLNRFTSINEDENIIASVYPNPTTNILFIQSFESIPNANIDIYDINGNVVFSKQQNINENNKVELNISTLITGTYQVRISNNKKATWAKFIKE